MEYPSSIVFHPVILKMSLNGLNIKNVATFLYRGQILSINYL